MRSLGEQLPAGQFRAAVLVLLAGRAGDESVLLQVRSRTVSQPGEICLPGGGALPGETPLQTALREAQEETGLDPALAAPIGVLSPQGLRRDPARLIQPVVARCPAKPALKADAKEVEELFWVPLAFFKNTPCRQYSWNPENPDDELPPALLAYLKKYPRPLTTGYWQYEGKGIWGLTARVLRELAETNP